MRADREIEAERHELSDVSSDTPQVWGCSRFQPELMVGYRHRSE